MADPQSTAAPHDELLLLTARPAVTGEATSVTWG